MAGQAGRPAGWVRLGMGRLAGGGFGSGPRRGLGGGQWWGRWTGCVGRQLGWLGPVGRNLYSDRKGVCAE